MIETCDLPAQHFDCLDLSQLQLAPHPSPPLCPFRVQTLTPAVTSLYPPLLDQIPYSQEDYEAAKARDPELFTGVTDTLQYGKAPQIPESNVDKMVSELTERCRVCAAHDQSPAGLVF